VPGRRVPEPRGKASSASCRRCRAARSSPRRCRAVAR
jgi:hypothetical protein